MAVLTALYLCDRAVCAAVGVPAPNGARVRALAGTQLPEGCLKNGVITDRDLLADALRTFFAENSLPTGRVALVLGGSAFCTVLLQLPRLRDKQRRAVIAQELDAACPKCADPLDDYMVLERDRTTRTDTLLAARVAQSTMAQYAALAQRAGLRLHSVDHALAGQIKLTYSIPTLAGQSFTVLQLDDASALLSVYEGGHFRRAARSTVYAARGTDAWGRELAQRLHPDRDSTLLRAGPAAQPDVYLAGAAPGEQDACLTALEKQGLRAEPFPASPSVCLPEGELPESALLAVGGLIAR